MTTKCGQAAGVELIEEDFDTYKDQVTGDIMKVKKFTWKNANGYSASVLTYGATINSLKLPDRDGNVVDINLGFDSMEGYLQPLQLYIGATVGRVANRIAGAKITLEGKTYDVTANFGEHMLHGGGPRAFDKVNWNHYVKGRKLYLSYMAKDLEEGFPGDLVVTATFELTHDNRFVYEYKAMTSKPTYINMTNHAHFNLAGHAAGAEELMKHIFSINGDHITESELPLLLQTGRILPVGGTAFDLRIPRVLGDVIDKTPEGLGYDINYCITKGSEQGTTFAGRSFHPPTGRVMEVYSNQPGLLFYTSNGMPEDPKNFQGDKSSLGTIMGKENTPYYKFSSYCMETGNYPDALRYKNFPNPILYPGELYHHTVEYRFFVE